MTNNAAKLIAIYQLTDITSDVQRRNRTLLLKHTASGRYIYITKTRTACWSDGCSQKGWANFDRTTADYEAAINYAAEREGWEPVAAEYEQWVCCLKYQYGKPMWITRDTMDEIDEFCAGRAADSYTIMRVTAPM